MKDIETKKVRVINEETLTGYCIHPLAAQIYIIPNLPYYL